MATKQRYGCNPTTPASEILISVVKGSPPPKRPPPKLCPRLISESGTLDKDEAENKAEHLHFLAQ